jgi:hypothetical protein
MRGLTHSINSVNFIKPVLSDRKKLVEIINIIIEIFQIFIIRIAGRESMLECYWLHAWLLRPENVCGQKTYADRGATKTIYYKEFLVLYILWPYVFSNRMYSLAACVAAAARLL